MTLASEAPARIAHSQQAARRVRFAPNESYILDAMLRKRGPHLLAAVVAGILAVPAIYSLQRAGQVLFTSEPNPAAVISSSEIAMFWRLIIAAYFAPMVGLGAYAAARRDLAFTMRRLYIASLIVAGMSGAQGILLP
jgi:hypothetical protein